MRIFGTKQAMGKAHAYDGEEHAQKPIQLFCWRQKGGKRRIIIQRARKWSFQKERIAAIPPLLFKGDSGCSGITKLQYSEFQAVFISPWSSREKQRILTELLSHLDPPKHHAATTLFSYEKEDDPMMDTSLLATCIGNRSAVLYEMNRTQVRTTNLPVRTIAKYLP